LRDAHPIPAAARLKEAPAQADVGSIVRRAGLSKHNSGSSTAHQVQGTLLRLPLGTIDYGTGKQFSIDEVQGGREHVLPPEVRTSTSTGHRAQATHASLTTAFQTDGNTVGSFCQPPLCALLPPLLPGSSCRLLVTVEPTRARREPTARCHSVKAGRFPPDGLSLPSYDGASPPGRSLGSRAWWSPPHQPGGPYCRPCTRSKAGWPANTWEIRRDRIPEQTDVFMRQHEVEHPPSNLNFLDNFPSGYLYCQLAIPSLPGAPAAGNVLYTVQRPVPQGREAPYRDSTCREASGRCIT
jgi:hypothetical protein